jgi:thymidylate synthase (FAD)
MEVTVLQSTENPERLVCQAARGDYYEGYVGDSEYAEIMEPIDYEEQHLDGLPELCYADSPNARRMMQAEINTGNLSNETILEAKTRAFIEEQLTRGHYGPLEHPQITFSVKGVSRVTMAQITRHRHLTFDIQSMRYADFSEQEIVVPATLLSDEERHERYPHVYDEDGFHFNRDEGVFDMSEEKRSDWRAMFVEHRENAREFYQEMVEAGIPKEDARFILPLGTTVNMTFSGNARTFLHLLDMRRSGAAQWEIRELSEALLDELFEWAPYTFEWYAENGPNKLSP